MNNDQYVDRVIYAIGDAEEYLEGITDAIEAHCYLDPENIGPGEAEAVEVIVQHLMDAFDGIAFLRMMYEDRAQAEAKAHAEMAALAQVFFE